MRLLSSFAFECEKGDFPRCVSIKLEEALIVNYIQESSVLAKIKSFLKILTDKE